MSAAASEPADTPETQPAAASVDQPIAAETSEPAKPTNIEESAPKVVSHPPQVVERISPPASELDAAAARAETAAEVEDDIFAIIAESRTVLARSVESISDEFASFARQSIDNTANTAIQMLRITTWANAVAVNTSYAQTSYDHWLDSAAKVSEFGLKLALESSKPLLNRIAKILSSPAD
jgi:hypothetical protein